MLYVVLTAVGRLIGLLRSGITPPGNCHDNIGSVVFNSSLTIRSQELN